MINNFEIVNLADKKTSFYWEKRIISLTKVQILLIKLYRNKKEQGTPIPHSFLSEHNLAQKLISELLHSNRLIKVHYDDVNPGSKALHHKTMIYAKKIRLKPGYIYPYSILQIATIYLVGVLKEGFYSKEFVHDLVKRGYTIKVNIGPRYPELIAAISSRGEKYVRSAPNDTPHDNLLKLPLA